MDVATDPNTPLTPEEEATLNALQRRKEAAAAAQRAAAQEAITALTGTAHWASVKADLASVIAAFPDLDPDINYTAMCMGRIETRFASAT